MPDQKEKASERASLAFQARMGAKVAYEYAYFKGRRVLRRAKPKSVLRRTGQVVVFDMDETLLRANTILELFKLVYGEKEGKEIIGRYVEMAKTGKCSSDQAMLLGYEKILSENRVTRSDAVKLVDLLERQGKIRTDLVELAQALKAEGRTVVLASRMSQTIADVIAERYGFDFAVGTREEFSEDGGIKRVKELVGEKNGRVRARARGGKEGSGKSYPVVKKLTRVRRELKKRGMRCRTKRMTLVSDGYDDIKAFKQAGISIMLAPPPESRDFTHNLSLKLKLADAVINPGPRAVQELELRLREPETIRLPRRRFIERLRKFTPRRRA